MIPHGMLIGDGHGGRWMIWAPTLKSHGPVLFVLLWAWWLAWGRRLVTGRIGFGDKTSARVVAYDSEKAKRGRWPHVERRSRRAPAARA